MDNQQMKKEARQLLEENILPFWMNRMEDVERGGFYGRMDGQGTLHADAPRGAVLNARILWAFAAAYRVLGKPEYLAAATRARDTLMAHFIDSEQGGVFWSVAADGRPLDTKKQTYAQALPSTACRSMRGPRATTARCGRPGKSSSR
jgi:mannobiose 2-epimerase